jgi:hypothetical protein
MAVEAQSHLSGARRGAHLSQHAATHNAMCVPSRAPEGFSPAAALRNLR